MASIKFYTRGWTGCSRAREYLVRKGVSFENVDVRKKPVKLRKALDLLKGVSEVYAKMGTKLQYHNLKIHPLSNPELLKLLKGREGLNMRAPVLRAGDKVVAGFDPGAYDKVIE